MYMYVCVCVCVYVCVCVCVGEWNIPLIPGSQLQGCFTLTGFSIDVCK